ncbi:hypothetical protein ACFL17_06160 [Pseudomonadota bacterium]
MKLRKPGTLSTAITLIKTNLGEEICANVVDRSASLVRKWADPDDPALPNLQQGLQLDAAYIRAGFGEPPVQAWYASHLERIVSQRPEEALDIVLSTLGLQSAVGELSGVIADMRSDDAIDGGVLSDNEQIVLLGLVAKISDDVEEIEEFLQGELGIGEE